MPLEQANALVRQYEAAFLDVLHCPKHVAAGEINIDANLLSRLPAKTSLLESPVQLLHEFVELQAKRIPDKIAFEFLDREETGKLTKRVWTYKELNDEGDKIAELLIESGVEPGA